MSGGLYRLMPASVAPELLQSIEDGVVGSPYLGASPLGSEFVATQGFSVVFRRSALAAVRTRFPYLDPFIAAALFASSNAFYINPLLLTEGSRVEPHVDCRVVEAQKIRIIPTLVSVLYVRCPEADAGGTLVFRPGTEDEVRLQPRTGDLLHFRGRLLHAVTPLRARERRLSVVCEQYNLPPEALAGFPELRVLSDRPTS